MKVKFLRNYAGTLTNEIQYRAGDTADLDAGTAVALALAGVVEAEAAPVEAAPEEKKPAAAKKAK